MAHQTLPNILLSDASLVTKSYIVRFVDDDAFNPRVTAARVPLPRWRTESRLCRHPRLTPAVHSPAYLAAFAQFPNKRLIAVGKFERNVKYHLSMSSKLGFRVPRWNRNDTFLRAFVKSLLFFASHRASAVGNAARDSTSWGRHRGASARGQSAWAAAEGRGRRAVLTWGIPRQIEPDFRIFCTTICDFDETWSLGFF